MKIHPNWYSLSTTAFKYQFATEKMSKYDFSKRWIPPSRSTAPSDLIEQPPKRHRVCLPQLSEVVFYPLYGGYHSEDLPICFNCPSHALVWSLSRFKKDGLGNAWASSDLPHFLRFVGILPYKEGCITPTSRPTSFRPSKTEETFFPKFHSFALPNKMESMAADRSISWQRIVLLKLAFLA